VRNRVASASVMRTATFNEPAFPMKSSVAYLLALFALVVLPLQLIHANDPHVVVQRDVPYVPGGGNEQRMDLYLPVGRDLPIILYLHEGSLTSGDKKDSPYEAIGKNFARAGIGFIVANYRLGPNNKWPVMAEDCAAAFAWMKRNARRLHANPAKMFIVGHSSGALIAALLSTDEKYLKKYGCSLSDIAGCVSLGTMLNPSYDTDPFSRTTLDSLWDRVKMRENYESLFQTAEAYRDADPSRHITKNSPPFLILIAEAERFQPPILEQANRFAQSMEHVHVSVQIEVLKNRRHMTAMEKMAEPNDPTLLRILNFVRSHELKQ